MPRIEVIDETAVQEIEQLKLRLGEMARNSQDRELSLTKSYKDMTERKDQIEEELTRYQNQDRVIREKCDQLEGKTSKQQ